MVSKKLTRVKNLEDGCEGTLSADLAAQISVSMDDGRYLFFFKKDEDVVFSYIKDEALNAIRDRRVKLRGKSC